MANTTVTTLDLTINAQTEYTTTAATNESANGAETFDLDIPKDGKCIVIINNVAADQGSVTWSLAAGDFWAAGAALTGTIAQGKSYILQVESAKYKKSTGKMALTITPATGKILKTNHTLTLQTIKLAAN